MNRLESGGVKAAAFILELGVLEMDSSQLEITHSKRNIYDQNGFNKFLKYDLRSWLIGLPTILLFVFFVYEPIVSGVVLSLFKTKGFKIKDFAGLKNYVDVINDRLFTITVVNSFKYTIWSLLLGFLIPIIVAVIINEMVHWKSFMKISVYTPVMVPGVAAFLIWQFFFEPGDGGVLNVLFSKIGLPQLQYLQDPKLTIPLIVLTMTWKSFGSTVLIYLASLQGINNELYEAAAIDGAGILRKLTHITVPAIYNMARLMLILQIIAVFQVMVEPMVMTGGGPDNASVSLMFLNYKFAFVNFQAGKSMALCVIVSFFLIILTVLQLKLIKEKDTE